MPGQAKKATKKFEKSKLKGTLERRKDFAKIKQRHQVKAKKQARKARDEAHEDGEDAGASVPGMAKDPLQKFQEMSVDEFFHTSVDLPELGANLKRKRQADDEGEIHPLPASPNWGMPKDDGDEAESERDDSGSEDENGFHQGDLDALAEKDPEFHKYLQENDAELLDFDENTDFPELKDLSEDEAPKKKRKTTQGEEGEDTQTAVSSGVIDVTMETVNKWTTAMADLHSLRATREVVLAFRAAAHVNDDDGKDHKFSISSPDVYHRLVTTALELLPGVLSHHLPVRELASGKTRLATDSKKFRTLGPLLKSHLTSVTHLLSNLSDAATLKLTLSSTTPLLPYLLSFQKGLKGLLQTTVSIWSDTSTASTTRITAFLLLRRLFTLSDASIRESILRSTYQGLVKASMTTNSHTLSSINMLKNSACELWGLDANVAYTTAFVSIRQLAIHLRGSVTHPTKDSHKQIYNWQYTHSLDFWSRVLSSHCIPLTTVRPFPDL